MYEKRVKNLPQYDILLSSEADIMRSNLLAGVKAEIRNPLRSSLDEVQLFTYNIRAVFSFEYIYEITDRNVSHVICRLLSMCACMRRHDNVWKLKKC